MLIPYSPSAIEYHPYDPALPLVFQQVKILIKTAEPNLIVEHIGSTAVSDLGGKNILNILVACPSGRFNQTLEQLHALGFSEHPDKQEPAERPLRVAAYQYRDQNYGLHLHLMVQDSLDHQVALYFRDYLQNNPSARKQYEMIKKQAVAAGLGSEGYNQAKQPFIQDIIKQKYAS